VTFADGWGAPGEARGGQGPLRGYTETILARKWFVILSVVLCTLAAAVYAVTASKVYSAYADMLITPVPETDSVLGLGLLRDSTDPSGDFATATRLIDNPDVAAKVKSNLHLADSPEALLQQVNVAPVANSSIVTITASTGSPAKSQRLADGFAQAAVQVQTERLYQALDPAIKNLRARINSISSGPNASSASGVAQSLDQQLAAFEALRSAPDPVFRFETAAALPTGPSSPNRKLAIFGGLLAGLLIGIAGAFLLDALDPRRSLEDGSGLAGLSILTHVPLLGRSGRTRHAFDESFRSLRTTLRFVSAESPIGTIAVTSASEKEGKTTTSFQLAMAILEAGQSVLLVEADPFRPGLRALLDTDGGLPGPGLFEYLSEAADLDDVIEQTLVPGLTIVSAGSRQPRSITGLLEGERGRSFVNDLAGLADLIILDCPPVGLRSDAVLIASRADAVIVVADLRHAGERDVQETVRRLRQAGARLLGIVLNRDTSSIATYDYHEEKHRSGVLRRTVSP
jgi:capsular exopolysaccharide synthesis family protein